MKIKLSKFDLRNLCNRFEALKACCWLDGKKKIQRSDISQAKLRFIWHLKGA